jgi:NTE family protein
VATGRTVVFMQTSPDLVIPAHAPPRTLFRADHIGPQHALASAAIPLLFPPVKIDAELYLDGGLRQNTPIAPAIRLGATHIFTIGSSREVKGVRAYEGKPKSLGAPGMPFLMGKILNAFLLDHVDVDLELLRRLNTVLTDGTQAFGPDFTDALSRQSQGRGAPAYRYVHNLTVRPSEDIGRLASDHVRRGRFRGDPLVARRLFSLLDMGAGDEADLASYLLFDGAYCKQLIEMGRADAKARKDDLLAFFGDHVEDGGGLLDGDEHTGSYSANSIRVPNIGTSQ